MKHSKFINWFIALGVMLWPVLPATAMEAPTLDVLVPENGEVWTAGSTQNITWDNGGFILVDIAYTTTGSESGPWTTIALDVDANAASYTWTVPSTPTTTALIRLYGHFPGGGPERFEYGDGVFTIANPVPTQTLTVIRPNGGELWRMGSLQLVRWTSTGLTHKDIIRVELNRGNGKWQTIGITPNFSLMLWRVTGPKTNTALVRVSLVKKPQVNDVSDRFFRISNR